MSNGPIGFTDEHTDRWTAYVRGRKNTPQELRIFGPKSFEHPSCGSYCLACQARFAEGDYTTLIELGPGSDGEMQERARDGRWYNAVAVEIHAACAGLDINTPSTEAQGS